MTESNNTRLTKRSVEAQLPQTERYTVCRLDGGDQGRAWRCRMDLAAQF